MYQYQPFEKEPTRLISYAKTLERFTIIASLLALAALVFAACAAPAAPTTVSPTAALQATAAPIDRALALKPRLLLLDEPTAGMNPTETAEMLELSRGFKRTGLTLLLTEHKLELVMQLSRRILVMDNGKKIAQGAPQEIRSNANIIEAYLGHKT